MTKHIRIIGGPVVGDPAEGVAVVGDRDDQLAFVAAEDTAEAHRGASAAIGLPERTIADYGRFALGLRERLRRRGNPPGF